LVSGEERRVELEQWLGELAAEIKAEPARFEELERRYAKLEETHQAFAQLKDEHLAPEYRRAWEYLLVGARRSGYSQQRYRDSAIEALRRIGAPESASALEYHFLQTTVQEEDFDFPATNTRQSDLFSALLELPGSAAAEAILRCLESSRDQRAWLLGHARYSRYFPKAPDFGDSLVERLTGSTLPAERAWVIAEKRDRILQLDMQYLREDTAAFVSRIAETKP
jgi:hypothetical protein